MNDLNRGVKWLLGAIIVALIGAVTTPLVAGWFGPDELGAQLSEVSIDRNVSLHEYAFRRENDSASEPNRATIVRLESHLAAQTTPETATETTPETATETTPETATETTPETTPETDETTPDETTPDDGGGGLLGRLQLSDQDRERLNAGVGAALADSPEVVVPDECDEDASSPDCGLGSLTAVYIQRVNEDGSQPPVSAATVARRLAKVFDGTRTNNRELVGVTVNFNVSMTGFDGGRADIRWSLYRAGSGGVVPRDWLRNQHAVSLEGQAEKDSGSDQFWVPLPSVKGPFFIRLGVYNEDDTRLDYANTPRFR